MRISAAAAAISLFGIGYLIKYLLHLTTFCDTLLSGIPAQGFFFLSLILLTIVFFLILLPLERIADYEARQNNKYTYRTSAREHLQRRGSF
ncbi:uncharacterized protein VTP21DRAFT_611 [Calcarisporiella thermophila]|uniref:uncharacterized protein n=1 Tax=Calcarisporiella thermophila TaxID=911321 RepID=UPI0037429072